MFSNTYSGLILIKENAFWHHPCGEKGWPCRQPARCYLMKREPMALAVRTLVKTMPSPISFWCQWWELTECLCHGSECSKEWGRTSGADRRGGESMVLALENEDPSKKANTQDERRIFMFTLYFFTFPSEPMPTWPSSAETGIQITLHSGDSKGGKTGVQFSVICQHFLLP